MAEDDESSVEDQNGDVAMGDASPTPIAADRRSQTKPVQSGLSQGLSILDTTPSKGWGKAAVSSAFGMGSSWSVSPENADGDSQFVSSKPVTMGVSDPSPGNMPHAPGPFSTAPTGLSTSQFGSSGFGTQPAPGATPFGQTSSLFGNDQNSQIGSGFGQSSSPFGAPSATHNQGFGQSSSLFGTGPAPVSSPFNQATSSGFGLAPSSGSLRFGFGQEPQTIPGATTPFAPLQTEPQSSGSPYPESYLNNQEQTILPNNSENTFGRFTQKTEQTFGFGSNMAANATAGNHHVHDTSLWPTDTYTSEVKTLEGFRSEDSLPEATSPGMIPPHVEDGTHNPDETKQQGIVYQPVYRQGVPPEALADQGDASADEGSMDSDEEAAYNEDDKGDDYDLRNYDRVSDDEEGYDEDEEPLEDDELLDEDEEDYSGEEGYDEENWDRGDHQGYYHPAAARTQFRPPPQPPAKKEPIIIDLLSDSDDDEPPPKPAAPPTASQPTEYQQHENQQDRLEDVVRYTSVGARAEGPAPTCHPTAFPTPPVNIRLEQDSRGLDAEMAEVKDNEAEEPSDKEGDTDDDDIDEHDDDISHTKTGLQTPSQATVGKLTSDEEIITITEQGHPVDSIGHEDLVKQAAQQDLAGQGGSATPRQPSSDADAMDVDQDHHNDSAGSFQTQLPEMLSSSQVTGAADIDEPEDAEDRTHEASHEMKAATPTPSRGSPPGDFKEYMLESQAIRDDQDVEMADEGDAAEHESFPAQRPVDSPTKQQDATSPIQDAPDLVPVDIAVTTTTTHTEVQLSQDQQTVLETQKSELVVVQQTEDRAQLLFDAHEEASNAIEDASPAEIERPEADPADELEALTPDVERQAEVESTQDPEMEKAGIEPVNLAPQPQDDSIFSNKLRSHAQPDGTVGNAEVASQKLSPAPEMAQPSPVVTEGASASFMSTTSQASENDAMEEVESAPVDKTKRRAKKTRVVSSSKSEKAIGASKRSQRQTSSQQDSSTRRTTRSKTMSFQKRASQTEDKQDKEDMSIQLARAALKPAPAAKTKRKVSATSGKRVNTDLAKRLDNDMPDCVPLKDLRKYNGNAVDVAVVATSAHTSPKRTTAREYASSFTVTDPSLALEGAVEIDLYSLHRDHLPVVKLGDSILLRRFTVVSLPGRGFGLRTKNDESSWAVFEANGDGDEPQMRAAPVEMNQKETQFLLDLRSWFGGMDEAAKTKLNKAVDDIVESGREARENKAAK